MMAKKQNMRKSYGSHSQKGPKIPFRGVNITKGGVFGEPY